MRLMLTYYFFLLAGVGVLAVDAYRICKRCNMSYITSKMHDLNKNAFAQDASYLPEDDYVEKLEGEEMDQQLLDRHNRNLIPEYRSLCEIVTKRVQLDDSEYEYQPPHYHEIYCKNFSSFGTSQRSMNSPKQKCVNSVFHCVQRSKTLFFVRRQWGSKCWEPYGREIASGCDCMWPVSDLEEITYY